MLVDYLQSYPHPGKYEGEILLAEHLDEMDGADEEIGSVDELGNFRFFDLTAWNDVEEGGTIHSKRTDNRLRAAILHTDSQGFVYGRYFASVKTAKVAWAEIEAEYETFYAEQGEED